jgi:sec-independent protein translocase protein TatB
MFDMGFLELLLIGIIALIVLGPERLPKAARTLGLWVGKAKQGFESIKTEIDRELKLKELQQELADQKSKIEAEAGLASLEGDLNQAANTIHNDVMSLGKEFTASDQAKLPTSEPSETSESETTSVQKEAKEK